MNILIFAPIIIVAIAVFLLVTFYKKTVYFKNSNKALMIYISLLVVLTVIYFIVPKSDFETEAVQTEEQINEQAQKDYAAIESGNIDQVKKNIIDQQSFKYNGKELILEESPGMEEWYAIFVEIKDENDGIVNFMQLHTGAYVNDVDVSEYLKPAKFYYNDGKLIFNDPQQVSITKATFSKGFPITQFSGNNPFVSTSSSYAGSILMYIQVPKNIVVKNETRFDLQYVEK